MKYLYLYRHADAAPQAPEQTDHERTLSPRGQEEAARIGQFLAGEEATPELVLCSSAVRTRMTLEITGKYLPEQPETLHSHALYLASAGDMFHVVQGVETDAESIMLIGHNPGIHEFALMLARHGDTQALNALKMAYPTACLAFIGLPIESWKELSPLIEGTLMGLVAPQSQLSL